MEINPDILYKPIKVHHHNVLFWGCLHLCHDPSWEVPIWKQRGYNSAQEHFNGLINNWNAFANNQTTGFLLGDTIFGKDADKNLATFFESTNFDTIYMMSGNHYAGWSKIFSQIKENCITFGRKKVIFVPNYLEAIVAGQPIVMSHYPILSWNGAAKGSWMLYAHVHGNLNKSEIGRMYQSQGKSHEVSVENCPFPAALLFLTDILGQKSAYAPDHHAKDTQNPF